MGVKYYNTRIAVIGILVCLDYAGWEGLPHIGVTFVLLGLFIGAWLLDAFIQRFKCEEELLERDIIR